MDRQTWTENERASVEYEPPSFEVISLCCEITAYAPDDEPLF